MEIFKSQDRFNCFKKGPGFWILWEFYWRCRSVTLLEVLDRPGKLKLIRLSFIVWRRNYWICVEYFLKF